MSERNPKVDAYLAAGCGRCGLFKTPRCKAVIRRAELEQLREIALACGLKEELKWSIPCYTHEGRNIVLLAALNDCSTLSFLKGALLKDEAGILSLPGENTQAGRVVRITSPQQVTQLAPLLKAYIREAIEIEKSGRKVTGKQVSEFNVPPEFQRCLDESPDLKTAFAKLTPGRQRSWLLHIGGAKQAATRAARVEKAIPQIIAGKGFHD